MRSSVPVGLALLAACGRFGFDAGASGDGPGAEPDGGPQPTHLLFHYTFDGALLGHDSAGAHDATCTSCPTATAGHVGSGAAAFDGTAHQCLVIGDATDLRPAVFTFAVSATISSTSTRGTIVGRGWDADTTVDNTYQAFFRPSSEWHARVNLGEVMATVASDQWHHIAGVFDGSLLKLYIDGTQAAATTATTGYAVDITVIGCEWDAGAYHEWLTAAIDDEKSWAMMEAQNQLQQVDFLKVGHHGSHNATPVEALLRKLLPTGGAKGAAIVSTASESGYGGVPDDATLKRIKKGATIESTESVDLGKWVDVEITPG